jgi:hypothetical protein
LLSLIAPLLPASAGQNNYRTAGSLQRDQHHSYRQFWLAPPAVNHPMAGSYFIPWQNGSTHVSETMLMSVRLSVGLLVEQIEELRRTDEFVKGFTRAVK